MIDSSRAQREPIAERALSPEIRFVLPIFLFVFAVFLFSPVSYVGDSKYSLLLSESLLRRQTFRLDGYSIARETPVRSGQASLNGSIYQIEVVGDHLYYYFPPGSSILSIPFVVAASLCGMPISDSAGGYNARNEAAIQSFESAALMAALAALFYVTSRLLLPRSWSVLVSIGGAFGTQIWSTASRGLWSHTWGTLLLGWAIYLLLAEAAGKRHLPPVLLGTILSWAYFVRPTNSLFILGITVYILVSQRRVFWRYTVTGAIWLGLLIVYSWSQFHSLLPSYYGAGRLRFNDFSNAFLGNLISPSRGLLIYVPLALFIFVLTIVFWRQLFHRRLVLLSLSVCGMHLIIIAGFSPWFGGVCYGARYTTELTPWLVLLTVLSLDVLRRSTGVLTVRAIGAFLLALSVLINGRGALAQETAVWNNWPETVDADPSRIWDWHYPQFLAGLISPPFRWPAPALTHRLNFADGAAKAFELDGWSESASGAACSNGPRARLVFGADRAGNCALRLRFAACSNESLIAQTVKIDLNGRRIATLRVHDTGEIEYTIPLAVGALFENNLLVFQLPDAAPDKSGIALSWIELIDGKSR